MEILGTLGEILSQAIDLPDDPRAEPLQLFVQDCEFITIATPAMLCRESGGTSAARCQYDRYRYVLMLGQVKEVLFSWQMRTGRRPTSSEACQAVLHFSENDQHWLAELPLPRGDFSWRVHHWRGEG
jgi:hypothetical protein